MLLYLIYILGYKFPFMFSQVRKMMRLERRRLLDQNLLVFINDMDIDSVIIFLKTNGILTNAVVDKVMTAGSPLHMRTALIRSLKTRGDAAFDKFFLALLRSGQNHLAMLLRPLVDESVLLSTGHESFTSISERSITREELNLMIQGEKQISSLHPVEPTGLLENLHVEMIDGDVSTCIEQYEKNKHLIYPNFSAPKGLCLIINNERFSTMTRRQGTEIDQNNLSNLFNQLGYTIIIENDLTCKEMLFRIRSFAADPLHRNTSSAIVVVLTHGERDNLFGVGGDEVLSINNFLGELNARNAPLLAEKPKLIFIQACRGEQRDPGFSSYDHSDCSHEDGPLDFFSCVRPNSGSEISPQRLPLEADFLVSYATPPRFVSWRNSLKGSWFIQAICQVFARHSCDSDILNLMTMVNQRVALGYQTNCSNTYKQMPEFSSRLTKKFFFYPGVKKLS